MGEQTVFVYVVAGVVDRWRTGSVAERVFAIGLLEDMLVAAALDVRRRREL